MNYITARQIASEKKITQHKLESTSDSLAAYLEIIEDIALELGLEKSILEIVKGEGEINRYTDAGELFENAFKYNDFIAKIQLLSGNEIVWQYGSRLGYAMGDGNHGQYVQLIESQEKYDIWAPAHKIYLLDKGEFSKEVWFSSYYRGIYDADNLTLPGVLVLHVEEETLCSIYQSRVEGQDSICWILNEDGQVVSATDKSFFKEKLPKELVLDIKNSKNGSQEIVYMGKKMQIFWNQCGNTDNYLFQMRQISGVEKIRLVYMALVILIFFIFCVGFLLVYNKYVLFPLRRLSGMIESTNDLNLRREILPVYGDEIGNLTIAYGNMMDRIEQLIQEVYVETIRTQEAEKEALLAQINPHFLYNTLDSIRWNAIMNGDKEVGKQLEALSVMLRETLNFGNKYTTLEQEITIIKNYCYLLQARFRKEIDIQIEIEPGDVVWRIPKLLIQPLVENAYKHGLENKVGSKHIWVKVKRFQESLVIYVADDGAGCDANRIKAEIESEGESCFALRNVKERIRMEYGETGKFLFYSHLGKGTLVKLFLQLDIKSNEAGIDS